MVKKEKAIKPEKVLQKRGRKLKSEYYLNKQMDNVEFAEELFVINLPITLEDCIINSNVDMVNKILTEIPSIITGYDDNCYAKLSMENATKSEEIILQIDNKPLVSSDTIINSSVSVKMEIYDMNIFPKDIAIEDYKNYNFKTNIHCWWCCHSFDTTPVFMPEHLTKKGIYKVSGCFCSYECCFGYMKQGKYAKNCYLLKYMYRELSPMKNLKIVPALPKETLKIFGGILEIEEFRLNNINVIFNKFPIMYIPPQIEVKKIKSKTTVEVKKILPMSGSKNEVKIPNNSLSKILGIKKK